MVEENEKVVKKIKGGGTRLKITLFIGVVTTIAWVITAIALFKNPELKGQLEFVGVGFSSWESTMTWLLGIYGTTEVGVYGSSAYMNKRG